MFGGGVLIIIVEKIPPNPILIIKALYLVRSGLDGGDLWASARASIAPDEQAAPPATTISDSGYSHYFSNTIRAYKSHIINFAINSTSQTIAVMTTTDTRTRHRFPCFIQKLRPSNPQAPTPERGLGLRGLRFRVQYPWGTVRGLPYGL